MNFHFSLSKKKKKNSHVCNKEVNDKYRDGPGLLDRMLPLARLDPVKKHTMTQGLFVF